MTPSEKNAQANRFRKEVENIIGSPYRISEYISYRVKGMSPEKALEKTKQK